MAKEGANGAANALQDDLRSPPAEKDVEDANTKTLAAWHAGYGAGYNNGRVDGYQHGRQAHAEADAANPALEQAQSEQQARVQLKPEEQHAQREQ